MKKSLLTTLTLLSFSSMFGAIETPYYTDMASKSAIDPDWTVINSNADDKTWVVDTSNDNTTTSTGASYGVKYQYSSKVAADDWIISPAFKFESGKTYKVKFWAKTAGNNEDFTVYAANSASPEDLLAGQKVVDFASFLNKTWTQYDAQITVGQGGDFYLGIYAHSAANMNTIYIRGFYIAENMSFPNPVTNLSVTAGADRALEATLSWTLPTKDDDGNNLIGAATNVVITRDDVEIARIDGESTSFVDSAEYGLESGFHKYGVYVVYDTYDGDRSAIKYVQSSYIGPVAPIALPYSMEFETDNDFDIWTTIDVDGDYKNRYFGWNRYTVNSLIGGVLEIQNTRQGAAQDDWAITPPLKIEKAGRYNVSFKGVNNSNYYMDMTIYYGQDKTPDALTNKIAYIDQLSNQTNPHSNGQSCSYDIIITEPGTYYIGFHAHGDAGVVADIRLDDLVISKAEDLETLPYSAENISETAALALPVGYISIETDPAAAATAVIGENSAVVDGSIFKNESICAAKFSFDQVANVTISVSDQTPAKADKFGVSVSDGQLIADIMYPSQTAEGKDLFEITDAQIYLNDELYYTIEGAIVPGEKASHVIAQNYDGDMTDTFELVLSNLSGKSVTESGALTGVKDLQLGQGQFTVRAGQITVDRAADITVSDISGKIVKRANNAQALSISDLAHGVYIVSANGYKTTKFIK